MEVNYNNIAVLGGGNIALATSAELSSLGFKVNIFELPEFKSNIQPVIEKGGIGFSGITGSGFAKLNKVTTDMGEALKGVGIIIITVPAFAHKAFFEALIPHLQDKQVILIATAYFGCLRFAKAIYNTGKQVLLAEMNITPYTCSKTGPARLYLNGKREEKEIFIAALPAEDTAKVQDLIKNIYPGIIPVPNVLQTSLDNINWIVHLPITLLHRGLIERSSQYTLPLKDSIPLSVTRLMNDMERERLMLGRAFGLDLPPIEHCLESGEKTQGLEDAIRKTEEFGTYNYEYKDGSHKYMTEDLYYELPPLASLASLMKVPIPTIDSVIHIFSIIDNIDYMKEGINIEKMGLKDLGSKEVLKLVNKGL